MRYLSTYFISNKEIIIKKSIEHGELIKEKLTSYIFLGFHWMKLRLSSVLTGSDNSHNLSCI